MDRCHGYREAAGGWLPGSRAYVTMDGIANNDNLVQGVAMVGMANNDNMVQDVTMLNGLGCNREADSFFVSPAHR